MKKQEYALCYRLMSAFFSSLLLFPFAEASVIIDLEKESGQAEVKEEAKGEYVYEPEFSLESPRDMPGPYQKSFLETFREIAGQTTQAPRVFFAGTQNRAGLLRVVEAIKEEFKSHPESSKRLSELGSLYLQLGMIDLAAESFWKSISLDKKNLNALDGLGFALLSANDYENGLRVYEKLLEIYPDKYSYRFNKGTALYNLKRYDQAREIFAGFREYDQNDYKAIYNLAMINYSQGQYEAAEKLLQTAHQLRPESSFPLCALVKIYDTTGNKTQKEATLKVIDDLSHQEQARNLLGNPEIPLFLVHHVVTDITFAPSAE